jgi:predicted RNA binding protein YcfA (HicA-like mRNA interferase family)
MRYSTSKDCQQFITALVRAGWQFYRRGKHGKLVSPEGKLLVVSQSPSDWRTLRNLRAEFRRLTQQP